MIPGLLKKIPIDLGQGELRHKTAGKRIALRHVPRPPPVCRALDAGCGDGYWSRRLKEMGYAVDSMDLQGEAGKTWQVDAQLPLPWEDGTFDLVWCAEVLEHLEDPAFSLREFRRILKEGGILIATTPNSGCWIYRLLALFGLPPQKVQNPQHRHFFKLTDVAPLFPDGRISGYFPYALAKFEIRRLLGSLTPTFIIVEQKETRRKEDSARNQG